MPAQLADVVSSAVVVGRPIGESLSSVSGRLRTILGRPYYDTIGKRKDVVEAIQHAITSNHYDVVIVSQPFMGAALPGDVLRKTVYDSHNFHEDRLRESFAQRGLVMGVSWSAHCGQCRS